MTELEVRMESLRAWISEEDEGYQFAVARGDWTKAAHHKKLLANLRGQFGALLKKKLQGKTS